MNQLIAFAIDYCKNQEKKPNELTLVKYQKNIDGSFDESIDESIGVKNFASLKKNLVLSKKKNQ